MDAREIVITVMQKFGEKCLNWLFYGYSRGGHIVPPPHSSYIQKPRTIRVNAPSINSGNSVFILLLKFLNVSVDFEVLLKVSFNIIFWKILFPFLHLNHFGTGI